MEVVNKSNLLLLMVRVRVMFGSNYNIFLFILAIESFGQMKWLTDP